MKSVTRSSSETTSRISRPSLRSATSSLSILSTARRQTRCQFAESYPQLCEMQHSHPISFIKQNLDKAILDFGADRIRFDEWWPIINALSCDKTLHLIAIRLRHAFPIVESANTELKARGVSKQPVVTTKFVLLWLAEAIRLCLGQSTSLTVLELEGLPLAGAYLTSITSGIVHSTSLQHFSLSKCNIGDEGAETVCIAIKNLPSVVSLDLSCCGLTEQGAEIISNLIRYQKLNRYSEAWKQTLRYRDPDVESMPGLRRITINGNPQVGDKGVEYLSEEIKDDLWLRALDVQECGLTDTGGRILLDMVKANRNLVIVDGRGNPYMNEELLTSIMNTLDVNNGEKPQSSYKWITKNPNLSKKAHQVSSSCRLRPWSCQVIQPHTRNSAASENSSFLGLRRSNTTLNQSSISLLKQPRPDRITDYEKLNLQLRDFTVILNQEVQEKLTLIEENKQLKEALEKSEMERKKLIDAQKNKALIDAETLRTIEETIQSFATYLTHDNEEEEEEGSEENTGRSLQDQEMPGLLSNLQLILNKAANTTESRKHQTHGTQQRHLELNKPITEIRSARHEKIYLNFKPSEEFDQNKRKDSQTQRKHTKRNNDHVIWEEEEDDRVPSHRVASQASSSKSRAQLIFAQMLGGNTASKKQGVNRLYKGRTTTTTDDSDSDYDSKSGEHPEKPLTSSDEDNSS